MEEAIKHAAAEKKVLNAEKNKAAKRLMAEKCMHGYDLLPEDSGCIGFISSFLGEYEAGANRDENFIAAIVDAGKAAKEKHPHVLKDSAKVGWIISHFVTAGTKNILDGENQEARTNASIAIFFEQYIEIDFQKTHNVSCYSICLKEICSG